MFRIVLVALSAALLVGGCGSRVSTADEADAGVDAATDGAPCSAVTCLSRACGGAISDCAPEPRCPQAVICPRPTFFEHRADGGFERGRVVFYSLDAAEAARCALEALRDGRVGRVSMEITGPWRQTQLNIDIVQGRRAYSSRTGSVGSEGTGGGSSNAALAPARFFEECLLKSEPADLVGCLEKAVEPCP